MNARLPHVERAGLADWLPFGAEADSPAEQFAAWLPYSAYLADEKLFVNRDGLGFLLELMPQSGADERMAEVGRIASGYVYYVSLKGVTGAAHIDTRDVEAMIAAHR